MGERSGNGPHDTQAAQMEAAQMGAGASAANDSAPVADSSEPIMVCLNERLNIWVYLPAAAHAVSII